MIKREDLSQSLLTKCSMCAFGGQDKFPDCIDFDPTKDCMYFDDINDDDPTSEDYDCGAYMHINIYNELRK